MRIGVMGPGRLGRHLAHSFELLGYSVALLGREGDQKAWVETSDVLCLAVRDDQLDAVIDDLSNLPLRDKTVLIHSGLKPLTLLDPLKESGAVVGKFHPLMAFSQAVAAPIPTGTPWAIEGPIQALVAPWVEAWNGSLHELTADQWPMYHLAATFASNFLPLFIRDGAHILEPLARDAADALAWLEPLIRQSVNAALDPANPLPFSGAAVRGDQQTLGLHRTLLAHDPDRVARYNQASAAIARLAREHRGA